MAAYNPRGGPRPTLGGPDATANSQGEYDQQMQDWNAYAADPLNWQPRTTPYGTAATGLVPSALTPQPQAPAATATASASPATPTSAGAAATETAVPVSAPHTVNSTTAPAATASVVAPPAKPAPTEPAQAPVLPSAPAFSTSQYDPRTGPPTWSTTGGGTAKTQDEFQQQATAYRSWLVSSGAGAASNADANSVLDPNSPDYDPILANQLAGGGRPPAPVPNQPTAGTGQNWNTGGAGPGGQAAGPGGDGITYGNGWNDGTQAGVAAWIAAGRPDRNGKKLGEPGYDATTGSGVYTNGSTGANPIGLRDYSGGVGGGVGAPGTFAGNLPASVQLSKIDPDASLRGYAVMPGNDPRLAATEAGVDQLAGQVQNFDLGSYHAVNPNDASTANAQSLLDQAASSANGATVQKGAAIAPTDVSGAMAAIAKAQTAVGGADPNSPEAAQARALTMQGLQGLQGPDRSALASQTFDLLGRQTQDQFTSDLRDVGRSASAFGRVGSGVTNTNLADVQTAREKMLSQAREDLSLQAAGQTLQDRIDTANATAGIGGQLSSEDLAKAGFGLQQGASQQSIGSQLENTARNTRAEQVGERTYGTEADQFAANLALQRSGALAGVSGQQFAQGQGIRNEQRTDQQTQLQALLDQLNAKNSTLSTLSGVSGQQFAQNEATGNDVRTERAYQDQLAQQAKQDGINQLTLEDALTTSAFNREQARLGLVGSYGYGANPLDAYFKAATNYSA